MTKPTLLCYGTPSDWLAFSKAFPSQHWGLVLDNGSARDVVFTMYENLARADAVMAFPSAHPVHLTSILAEAEVGNPLIVQQSPGEANQFSAKSIAFLGSQEAWSPFRELFREMKAQGLMREHFDRAATYFDDFEKAAAWLQNQIPTQIPTTRIHYREFNKRRADLAFDIRDDVRPPGEITVACFGSASTSNPTHLARADRVAKVLARAGFNILHGGGTSGVMGQLSASGARYKAFVYGITVHSSGAPKIFFERSDGDERPEWVDFQVASKAMLHRIETYAGHSHAFSALDGGIGSMQEILVCAELAAINHPALFYETQSGEIAKKPIFLMNEGRIYDPLVSQLLESSYAYLAAQISVMPTDLAWEQSLLAHFKKFPPKPKAESVRDFRSGYSASGFPTAQRIVAEEQKGGI